MWEAFRANKGELLFAACLLVISSVLDKSPLPILFIALPGITSVYLSLLGNKQRGFGMVEERARVLPVYSRQQIEALRQHETNLALMPQVVQPEAAHPAD
jgi:hypothetical protein